LGQGTDLSEGLDYNFGQGEKNISQTPDETSKYAPSDFMSG
jgi:hypothetical protein